MGQKCHFINHRIHSFFPLFLLSVFPSALTPSQRRLLSVSLTFSHPFIRKKNRPHPNSRLVKRLNIYRQKKQRAADSLASYNLTLVPLPSLHTTQVVFLTGELSNFFFVEIERPLTRRKPIKATVGLVLHDRPIVENSGLTGLLSNLTHCSGRHFNHWKITGYGL